MLMGRVFLLFILILQTKRKKDKKQNKLSFFQVKKNSKPLQVFETSLKDVTSLGNKRSNHKKKDCIKCPKFA